MRLRTFAAIGLLAAAGAATAVLALSRPAPTPAANGQMPEVVVRAPAPHLYTEEIVVRPEHVVDAGTLAHEIN